MNEMHFDYSDPRIDRSLAKTREYDVISVTCCLCTVFVVS